MSVHTSNYDKLDTARWLAALAVVLLHSAAAVLGEAEFGSTAWQWANVYDAATRWCVPVFVMISGVLLLDPTKQESLRRFYSRRARRILPATLFWSVFYLGWSAWQYRLKGVPMDTEAWIRKATGGEPYYHLWYLYMLIGLLLVTPFIRQFYRYCSAKQRVWVVVCLFLLAMLQSLYREIQAKDYGFFLFWFIPYLSYFWAGRMLFEAKRSFALSGVLMLILLCVGLTAMAVMKLSSTQGLNLYFYDNFSPTIVLMSMALFYLLIKSRHLPRLSVIAPYTFGVYLIHPLFLDIIEASGIYAIQGSMSWQIPLTAAVIFVLSLASIWLLRRLSIGIRLS